MSDTDTVNGTANRVATALATGDPGAAVMPLIAAGELPEVAALRGVPAGPAAHHGEGSAFTHTMMVVRETAALRPGDTEALWLALAHDLGKANTPDDVLPSHHGHAKRGVPLARSLGERLGLPSETVERMATATRHHMKAHMTGELNATTLLDMAKDLRDSPLGADRLVALAHADTRGRIPRGDMDPGAARTRLKTAMRVCEDVTLRDAAAKRGRNPDLIGDGVDRTAVEGWRRQDRAETLRARLSE